MTDAHPTAAPTRVSDRAPVHIARLYALVASVTAFFLFWAVVAAHPWKAKRAQDPRVAALAARQLRLQQESVAVKQALDRRWAAYRSALRARESTIAAARSRQSLVNAAAAAPPVRVVTLPPLVVTRTS
jgi:hypothetical protein